MRELTFEQTYYYGDNWEGKLKNIPDDALVYNIYNLSETQQTWVICFPIVGVHDMDEDTAEEIDFYFDYGCVQVNINDILDEYRFIILRNITPKEGWNDCGKERFDGMMNDWFGTVYRYVYKMPDYDIRDILTKNEDGIYVINQEFLNKDEKKLISVERLRGLVKDALISTTEVFVYDYYREKTHYMISDSDIEFNKLKDFGFHKEKIVVTHDSTIYDEVMENSIKWFKR